MPSRPGPSPTAESYTSRDRRLPPDQVLFARKNAPVRFAENDIYFANDALPDGGHRVLPDSNMLTAIHSYSSHFYEALALRQGPAIDTRANVVDERSMNETALIAFGVLLEEASRHALGKQGDLVFTEEEDFQETTGIPTRSDANQAETSRRNRKRRKLSHGATRDQSE